MPRRLVYERDQFRRVNRLLGHYLATCCWIGRADGLVLTRDELARFFGTGLHDERRVTWFCEDIEIWFPYHQELFYRASTVASLYLARMPFSEFPDGKMLDVQRIEILRELGYQIALYSDIAIVRSQVRHGTIEGIASKMLLVTTGDIDVTEEIDVRSQTT